jgi:hypothetical protein
MAKLNRLLQVREVLRETHRIAKIVIFGYSTSGSYWAAEKRIHRSCVNGARDVFARDYRHRRQLENAAEISGFRLEGDDFDLLFFVVRDTYQWWVRAMKEALCTHPSEDHYQIEEEPYDYPGLMQSYCGKCGGCISVHRLDRYVIN